MIRSLWKLRLPSWQRRLADWQQLAIRGLHHAEGRGLARPKKWPNVTFSRLHCLDLSNQGDRGGEGDLRHTSRQKRCHKDVLGYFLKAARAPQLRLLSLSHQTSLNDTHLATLAGWCVSARVPLLAPPSCPFLPRSPSLSSWCRPQPLVLSPSTPHEQVTVTHSLLSFLTARCHQLEALDLSWCRGVTVTGLGVLLHKCKGLQRLNLEFAFDVK